MAVEYLAHMFMFLREDDDDDNKNGDEGNATDPALAFMKNPIKLFTVHYVHDLESVYWLYLWFICNRLPTSAVQNYTRSPDSAKDMAQVREDILELARKYFGHQLEPNALRAAVIQQASSFLNVSRDVFDSLYSKKMGLLEPLKISRNLRREYIRLEQQTAPEQSQKDGMWRFTASSFQDKIYDELLQTFSKALQDMGDDTVPVEDLFVESDVRGTKRKHNTQVPTRSRIPKATSTKHGTKSGVASENEDGKGESKRQRSTIEERDVSIKRSSGTA
jgi:hypothetical protein